MQSHKNLALALLAAMAMAMAPAFAGNGNDNGKHDNGKHGGGKHGGGKHANQQVSVQKHSGKHARGDDDRLRHGGDHYVYADSQRAAGCPPGLAKKNNGCLPPGQAKKLAVGQPLPYGAVYTIPRRVLNDLPPPPAGYRYAVVQNQVVLVSSGNIVVDIIRSLLG